MQITQNLSLKTSNSQQNGECGLFLHQACYTRQSLVLDLDFPVLANIPKEPSYLTQYVASVTCGVMKCEFEVIYNSS